jgi:Transposase DDE domain
LTGWGNRESSAVWTKSKTFRRKKPFSDGRATNLGAGTCGPGEWLVEEHATRTRRSWRKLHIGVDADTGQIIAAELTSKDIDDGSPVGTLREQIAGPVASFAGDGACDRDDVYREFCQRYRDAAGTTSSPAPATLATGMSICARLSDRKAPARPGAIANTARTRR